MLICVFFFGFRLCVLPVVVSMIAFFFGMRIRLGRRGEPGLGGNGNENQRYRPRFYVVDVHVSCEIIDLTTNLK